MYIEIIVQKSDSPKEKKTSIQVPKVKANSNIALDKSTHDKDTYDEDGFATRHKPLKHVESSKSDDKENRQYSVSSRSSRDDSSPPRAKGKRKATDATEEGHKRSTTKTSTEKSKKPTKRAPVASIIDQYDNESDDDVNLVEEVSPPKKKSKLSPTSHTDEDFSITSTLEDRLASLSPENDAGKKKFKSRREIVEPAPAEASKSNGKIDFDDAADGEPATLIGRIAKSTAEVAAGSMKAKVSEVEKAKDKELERIVAHLQAQLSKGMSKYRSLKVEYAKVQESERLCREEATALEKKLKQSESSRKALSSEFEGTISSLDERVKEYEAKIQHVKGQNIELAHKLIKYKQLAQEASETARARKHEVKEWRGKAETAHQSEANQEMVDELRSELDTLRQQFSQSQEASDQLTELTHVLEQELESVQAQSKRMEVERDVALDMARREGSETMQKAKEIEDLKKELEAMRARAETAEAKAKDLDRSHLSVTPLSPSVGWRESSVLGPFENFFTIHPDESPKRWVITCRNPRKSSELLFTLESLEDAIEYVPLDFKDRNSAGDPSNLPDFLCRPIYFEPEDLAPFLGKMISFLYSTNK